MIHTDVPPTEGFGPIDRKAGPTDRKAGPTDRDGDGTGADPAVAGEGDA